MTMTFFGKFKNLGHPTPPRRSDTTSEFSWAQEEFDEEDGDTYEAPPCEPPPMKVQPLPVAENVYLERTSEPSVPQRQPAPPPKPTKGIWPSSPGKTVNHPQHGTAEFHDDSSTKPPQVDRNEKPGKLAQKIPVPSARAPAPTSNDEEDVYLDPSEDQDDNDEVYLEPTPACPPAPCGLMRSSPAPKTAAVSPHMPKMKPPVPRAMSNFCLPSPSEVKTAPSSDVRRPSIPPPNPSVKPLLANMKEAKTRSEASPSKPRVGDVKTAALLSGARATRQSWNEDKQWFAGHCTRETAEDLLLRVNKDGAFLIRYSSTQNTHQPYTLAVLSKQKVYNIHIRFLKETQGYALGKDGKKNEEEKIFSSLEEIISYYKKNHLFLIDSKSEAKNTTYLTHPVRP